MTAPAEIYDPADEQALRALHRSAVEHVAAEDPVPKTSLPPHRLYDPAAVTAFHRELDGRDSDSRRRMRKIVEAMLDERSAWRELARVPDNPDWNQDLRRDFPHFIPVLEHLQAEFALAALGDGALHCAPLLLLGDPGIGKSYFLRCLADTLATCFDELHFETATAGWILAGSDMAWANARHGRVFELLVNGVVANPLVLLEEVDKVGADPKYDPLGALYALLEPHSATCFQDECIPIPLDASRILWMATANEKDRVPAPLLSRFTVFDITTPTPAQAVVIAQSVYRKMRATEAWGPRFDPELPQTVAEKASLLPPRAMRKALWLACGRAAQKKVWRLSADDVLVETAPVRQTIGFS